MNSLVTRKSVLISIVAILTFAAGLTITVSSPIGEGFSVSINSALAFGNSGDGGCCGTDEPDQPDYDPPSYDPPDYPDYDPPPSHPKPHCSAYINPDQVNYGGSATLTWTSANATSATVTDFGSEPVNGSKALSNITANKTYYVTVYGPGGSATCSDTVKVIKPMPVCTINANPSTIQNGGSSTLTWTSSNATSASINQGIGGVSVNGNRSVSPTGTKTYTLTVTGPGGTANCQTTIIVQNQLPSCTFNINPNSVQYGGNATATWTSQNATSATINQGVGSVALNGSYTASNLTSTKTYIMTVTGPGGSATCQDTVTVQQQSAPSCTITVNPHSVQMGGSVSIVWSSNNATSATLTDFGSEPVNGSRSVSNINSNKTYVLTVTGPGGTATCQDSVVVQESPAPYCTISANPSSIQYGGSSTLTWSSNNATSAVINHSIGSVGVNGSYVVSNIYSTKTYIMTVYNAQGQSANCQTTIYVNEIQSNPSCTINANPNSIQQGGSSYLTWSSSNAISANLSTIGSVGVNGSQTVYPYNTTTYVLTVYGQNGQSAQCQTTVNIGVVYNNPPSCWISISNNNQYDYNNSQATLSWGSSNATSAYINPNVGSVSTYGTRVVYVSGYQVYTMTVYNAQGQSATCQTQTTQIPPYVALTQIPYTGIDLGGAGTMLYYFAILAFTVAAAYLAIYYVPAFAGIKARIPVETMEAPMIFARSVAAAVPFVHTATRPNVPGSSFKDAMTFARSENGSAPRIVIQRN